MENLSEYDYQNFKNEISEGRNEVMFKYKDNIYAIGMHGKEKPISLRSILRRREGKEKAVFWEFVDVTNCKVLLIGKKEDRVDKIFIDGKKLEHIWSEIEFV